MTHRLPWQAALTAATLLVPACQAAPGPGEPAVGGSARPAALTPGMVGAQPARLGPGARNRMLDTTSQAYTGAFLVLLAPGRTAASLLAAPGLSGTAISGSLQLEDRLLVRLSPPTPAVEPAWRRALWATGAVQGVQPEAWRFTANQPAPDMAADQWSHRPAFGDTEGAWAIVPDAAASKVVVAVIDSGLDETHPEFAGRVASGGLNTLVDPPSANISDDNGHGTHCAGIVAAANDQAGIRGVAPGAQILPMKVLDQQGAGTDMSILQGIMAAIAWLPTPDDGSRVRVLSLSLGAALEDVSALYAQAFAMARRRGIVVVAASGNESLDFVGSPANAPLAIAVGSTSRYLGWERLSGFSNGGHALALVAPGAAILSTYPRTLGDASGYAVESGTSMATPFVAGVAAQLVARYDPGNNRLDATWTDLARARLLAAVDDLGPPGRDDLYGEGRTNAHLAVYPQTLEGPVVQPTPAPPP